jgi:cell division inhibitor SulA/protein ImuA
MHKRVETLLQSPAIRLAGVVARVGPQTVSTGFPGLDRLLPGGGWPDGSLVEILSDRQGVGELSLLIPTLAVLSSGDRWLAWVSPPHIPYGPALAARGVALSRVLLVHARPGRDQLWAVEQMLAAGTCRVVLAWLDEEVDARALRRLQLAAESGKSTGFLFRSGALRALPTPAALRLGLQPTETGLQVKVLKCRGRSGTGVIVDVDDAMAEPQLPTPAARSARPRLLRH